MPSWDTDNGDIDVDLINFTYKIEVKGFSSDGPSSFGPKEKWDYLYFLDATNIIENKFIVYEINLSSNSETWKNIKINKNQSFDDQCKQGRRPRISFMEIKKQIPNNRWL